jgi:dephospho-CoA kinase
MIIGITGGIGSGKSRISRELIRRGYSVYDCDREAKRIIVENEKVRKAIINLLGEEAFLTSHNDNGLTSHIYNTAYVAKRVFEDRSLLKKLDEIVHPAVMDDIQQRQTTSKDLKPLFVESAILVEAGLDALCERIIVVDAPEDIRIERTIGLDYKGEMTEANINKVRARMRAQTPHTGDLMVWNDGKRETPVVVDEILTWLKKEQLA